MGLMLLETVFQKDLIESPILIHGGRTRKEGAANKPEIKLSPVTTMNLPAPRSWTSQSPEM